MRNAWLVPFTVLLCGPVLGQASIYDRCITAIGAGDLDIVSELAATIQRFNAIPANELDRATQCVSQAMNELMRFDAASGNFISAEVYDEELNKRREAYEARIVEQERRRAAQLERQMLVEIRQEINRSLIAADIFEACTDLYAVDKSRAVLNSLCVDSFNVNGHPKLVDYIE